MIKCCKTVKELKEFLNTLDENMTIVCYRNGMEKQGYLPELVLSVDKMSAVEQDTYDRFDGTFYTYEAFVRDVNGREVLSVG